MLPSDVLYSIEEHLETLFDKSISIRENKAVGGGCINNAAYLNTSIGDFFIKWNNLSFFYNFQKEVNGLQILKKLSPLGVPNVICCTKNKSSSILILEYISSKEKENGFWGNFGHNLAIQHKSSNPFFGFIEDNYIGSLKQQNSQTDNWIDFFILFRLNPFIKQAFNNKLLSFQQLSSFELLFSKLDSLLPKEPPSLLHGDLWAGNYMVGNKGEAVVFDPAVYFGHREMDIAMTKLFGGFPAIFYHSYNESYPFEKNWLSRVDLMNIYPLLVHLNLFGSTYLSQLMNSINRFI